MSTDDNDADGDLDESDLKFIYGQFRYSVKEVFCIEDDIPAEQPLA